MRRKRISGTLLVELFRALERLMPVWLFYLCTYPFASLRALRSPPPIPASFPDGWIPATAPPVSALNSTGFHMNNLLQFLPDRLCAPRWRKRCQIIGLDHLVRARKDGKPVMLAFGHFGPFKLTPFWLRANGIPITALHAGTVQSRSPFMRHNDRHLPFPNVPNVLYGDQLRELVRIFRTGGASLLAIDNPVGRLIDVPVGEGRVYRMATGSLRMAAEHGAELIPCNIIHTGPWRFRIELANRCPESAWTMRQT